MLRTPINKRLICSAFFPFSSSSEHDSEKKYSLQIIRNTVQKYRCYFYDEDGNRTKELQSVFNTTTAGVATGFILGALSTVTHTIETFKKENQATLFKDKFEPKKLLQQKISMNMLKGGIPFGAKLGMFCFLFSSMSTFLYVYKGKFDIMNHTISGAITGFIYKVNMGLKGVIAGSVLGTILGTISGFMSVIILYISGCEMEDMYTAGNRFMVARRQ
ncbi:RPII140-upstream gene protein [Habropoda laboriosa]|uniref:Complex I assembly factor TIMMDC1, mitochondrial n=2 Tax=Habropoda laboriosa TaxID=597456 RepID=A0A0L7R0R9_9HYME|nr:RPII140-upstream gene protein [Habropoda laboriosa]